MSNFRVLMLYPNLQNEMLVPPVLALFSALLKREGFIVDLFDTTNYRIETDFVDSDKVKMRNLNVRPNINKEPISKLLIHTKIGEIRLSPSVQI